jgi:hypothetical protein
VNSGDSAMLQFSNNLIWVKKFAAEWVKERAKHNKKDLKDVEEELQVIFDHNYNGVFSKVEDLRLKNLEGKKKTLLELDEADWRLKSHVV